jgi:MoaA/NifB/PqqE/SkfB family radical SAM enzyme
MRTKKTFEAEVSDGGRILLPPELAEAYGLRPGDRVQFETGAGEFCVRPLITRLMKVYIEPTNKCNLRCRTCIRNSWEEPLGQMSGETFTRIIEGLSTFSPVPGISFGGFGEPLSHPDIVDMVARAKSLGSSVEMVTNGTLLTPALSRRLIDAGLDMLWVSIDGASPESYSDIRLGATLPVVLSNLASLHKALSRRDYPDFMDRLLAKPQLGIAFVAMKRNIADLPSVLRIGNQMGATRFLVTNLLPYTAEMCSEVLYPPVPSDIPYLPSTFAIQMPAMDTDEITCRSLYDMIRRGRHVSLGGSPIGESGSRCPFIHDGLAAISWDGNLSPCLPLLHSHRSYFDGRERLSLRYSVGNITEGFLPDLWASSGHTGFRERVRAFDFSPCIRCSGCQFFETNEDDCFGNTFPTCGGCLWAHGLIQCP